MNSKSNYYDYEDFYKYENNHEYSSLKCRNDNPYHPTPTKSIFSCGHGSGISLPISVTNPIPVANVTIDTTCLCNPSVKIDFNSIINYQTLIDLGGGGFGLLTNPFSVTFRLSKVCGKREKITLGSWDYSFGLLALAVNVTNSFSFSYCECNLCPGCCTYIVEIVSTTPLITTSSGTEVPITISQNSSIRSSNIFATAFSH